MFTWFVSIYIVSFIGMYVIGYFHQREGGNTFEDWFTLFTAASSIANSIILLITIIGLLTEDNK